MNRTIQPDDSRLCRQWEINLSDSGPAVFVVLFLGRVGSNEPVAIHGMTPAQAREVGLLLFEGAEIADRRMNEAVQAAVVGECDTCHAAGVPLTVLPGTEYAVCAVCAAHAGTPGRKEGK